MDEQQRKADIGLNTGVQQVEPDAAYARLTGNIAHVHAEDLPAYVLGKSLRAYVNSQLKTLMRDLWFLLGLVLIPVGAGVGLEFGIPLLFGLGFIPDLVIVDPVPLTGGALNLSTLAGWCVLILLAVLPASVAFRKVQKIRSRLTAGYEEIRKRTSDLIAERNLGIGHERCTVGIGEAGFCFRSGGRNLKLRWHTLDIAATRARARTLYGESGALPEVPNFPRIPTAFEDIHAMADRPEWQAFCGQVEKWSASCPLLLLDMKCYRQGAERLINAGKSKRGRTLHERISGPPWTETIAIHRRFFDSVESELSWTQFVLFTLALAHTNAVPGSRLHSPETDMPVMAANQRSHSGAMV